MKKCFKLNILICLLIGMLAITGCQVSKITDNVLYGNTNGNISMGGSLVQDTEKNAYVVSLVQDDGILRKGHDESFFTSVYDSSGAYSLNIWKDYLYFVNTDEDHIYRMSLKNQTVSKICNTNVNRFLIFKDKIFFEDYNNANMLFVMSIEGSEPVLIKSGVGKFSITNNGIYYINAADNDYIYRMKLDGSNSERIIEKSAIHLNASDNYLFYSQYIDIGDKNATIGGIFSFDLQTNVEKQISKFGAFFNLYEEDLYFEDKSNPSPVMKFNGTNTLQFVGGCCEFIFCSENYLLVKKIFIPEFLTEEEKEIINGQYGDHVWILYNRDAVENWTVIP